MLSGMWARGSVRSGNVWMAPLRVPSIYVYAGMVRHARRAAAKIETGSAADDALRKVSELSNSVRCGPPKATRGEAVPRLGPPSTVATRWR